MRTFTALSLFAMMFVSVVVGCRLLSAARQTRQLPELFLGLGLLGTGVGLGFSQLGATVLAPGSSLAGTVVSAALFGLVVVGVVSFHVAIWRVFRPEGVSGLLSFVGGSALALVGYGMRIGAGDFADGGRAGPGLQLFGVAVISGLTWASIEALHLYWRLRKQIRLGLATPVSASQIGFWGVAASLGAVMTVVIAYNVNTLERSPLDDVVSTVLLLITVIGASTAMWCAFFPPALLRSRLSGARSQLS